MKFIAIFAVTVITFGVVGCISIPPSTYTVGKNFSSESTSKIVKGETSEKDLLSLFGEPFSKTVVSESEEKWIYSYSSGTTTVQRGFMSANVQSTGQRKMLDILLKNGKVTNFTYTDSLEPLGSVQVK